MANVITVGQRQQPAILENFLRNFLQQRQFDAQQGQQQQQFDAQNTQKADELNVQKADMLRQMIAKLRPEKQAAATQRAISSNPELGRYLGATDPSGLPPDIPTSQERLAQASADESLKQLPNLPLAARQQGTYQSAFGAAMPGETVKLTNANDVYSNKPSFAPEMQPRQTTEDKLTPTGGEKLTAATNVRTEGMRQAGETSREKMKLDATNKLMNPGPTSVPGATTAGGDLSTAPALVRGLIKRQVDPSFIRYMARTPQGLQQLNQLEAQIQAYDPNFSMAEYPKQVANLQEYSQARPTGKSITAIGTAIRHLNSYLTDLSAMKNTNLPAYNTAANWLATQSGNKSVQLHGASTDKDAQLVAREIERAVKGSSQYGVKDVEDMRRGLSADAAPAQGLGAAGGAVKLLAGRLEEIANSYELDTGLPAKTLLSDSRMAGVAGILKRFKKLGVEGTDEFLSAFGGADPIKSPATGTVTKGTAGATKVMRYDDQGNRIQ